MTVHGVDHVNLRVQDPAATIAFFVDILEMTQHPEVETWLVDKSGHPAVHIGNATRTTPADELRPFNPAQAGGPVHHVALACTGFDAVRARIEARGLDYRCNDRPERSFRQIFIVEPGGALLELNFRDD